MFSALARSSLRAPSCGPSRFPSALSATLLHRSVHQHQVCSDSGIQGAGMKLLTHNMMSSHVKGVKNGYPLILRVTDQAEEEMEFNGEFIVRMLPRIEYSGLRTTLGQLGMSDALPAAVPASPEEDEDFLKAMHHVLLEIQIMTGELECPESGTKFPIENGIPNMLLPEE